MKNKHLPEGWKEAELKDVCIIIMGQSPPGNSYNDKHNGTPFFQGKSEFGCKVSCCIGRGLAALRAMDKLDVLYLFHVLQFKEKEISNLGSGSTFKAITSKQLNSIKIVLPPLPIQKKIISILEKAEGLKQKREEADKLTKDYLQSMFYGMFEEKFDKVELGNESVLGVQSGGTPSKSEKEYWENGTIPWIGSTACKDLPIYESEQFITKEGLDNSSAKIFPKKTVLIALVGATIGKTGQLMFDCSTNQNIAGIIIKDKNKVDPMYLFFAVKQLYPKFTSLSNDTFKMANLSFIRKLEIPLPPLLLQQKFARIVEHVERLKEKQRVDKERCFLNEDRHAGGSRE